MNESLENDPATEQLPFRLEPGEQVTEAFALWAVSDRMAEERVSVARAVVRRFAS